MAGLILELKRLGREVRSQMQERRRWSRTLWRRMRYRRCLPIIGKWRLLVGSSLHHIVSLTFWGFRVSCLCFVFCESTVPLFENSNCFKFSKVEPTEIGSNFRKLLSYGWSTARGSRQPSWIRRERSSRSSFRWTSYASAASLFVSRILSIVLWSSSNTEKEQPLYKRTIEGDHARENRIQRKQITITFSREKVRFFILLWVSRFVCTYHTWNPWHIQNIWLNGHIIELLV